MTTSKGLSFNQLMKHMRESGIDIEGQKQKRQLMLSGYYHGYKGYRYCKDPQNRIPFVEFSQIQAVMDFDDKMKAILYRPIMQLETALKSIVSEIIVRNAGSDSFNVIIEKLMHANGHKDKDNFIQRKYKMRDEIYSGLTRAYKRNNIVKHYYNKDTYVPIWAIFEVITLGEFGTFVELLDDSIRLEISKEINIPLKYNTGGALLPDLIYIIRDLRNAIAHNGVIFDARFRGNRGISTNIRTWLEKFTDVPNITFRTVIDDLILVFAIMKNMKFRKPLLYSLVKDIVDCIVALYKSVGPSLYMLMLTSDTLSKLDRLNVFLRTR